MKGDVATVADYIARAPKWAQGTLRELRRVIRKAAPEARESISYQMPYYSQNGRLAYFAAFKSHCSFFWLSAQDRKTFANQLASQTVVGSTLRIPRGGKVPAALIQRIIRSRVRENGMKKPRGKGKTASATRRRSRAAS
ncbi:MAG TPA: DUF1801 domain-containing protein [Vicinamibacterales bacterium]